LLTRRRWTPARTERSETPDSPAASTISSLSRDRPQAFKRRGRATCSAQADAEDPDRLDGQGREASRVALGDEGHDLST
jgi:hypothetical protein